MNKNIIGKKTILITLVIFMLLCSIFPSGITNETKLTDIKLQLTLPSFHIPYQSNGLKIFNNNRGSGWPQIYDYGIEDSPCGIVIDSMGNIIVSGYTFYSIDNSTFELDFLTIKYDSEGNELWNVTYDSGTFDFAWDVAIDSSDNIIVYGVKATSFSDLQNLNLSFIVVKFNKDGVEQWNVSYKKEIDSYPGGVTVNSKDDIIINGGYGDLNEPDFHCWTLKMNSNGKEFWDQSFNEDIVSTGSDVAVDVNDNIIVGGLSASFYGQGYFTIEYDDNGNQIKVNRYKIGSQPNAIALDSNGNIILTGVAYSSESNTSSWLTIKSDRQGNLLWTREYDGKYSDAAEDLIVDSNDNIITVGTSCFNLEFNNEIYEHCTIIYDKNGNELCMKRPYVRGIIYGVIIDTNDAIIITGGADQGYNWNYYTDKYIDVTPPLVQLVSPKEKNLYIFGNKILKLPRNTIIIGIINILINAENPSDILKVEFYIDKNLRQTTIQKPYQFIWNDKLFFKHSIKIMAYDETGCIKKYEFDVWKFF
jgi:hypothetical protein